MKVAGGFEECGTEWPRGRCSLGNDPGVLVEPDTGAEAVTLRKRSISTCSAFLIALRVAFGLDK